MPLRVLWGEGNCQSSLIRSFHDAFSSQAGRTSRLRRGWLALASFQQGPCLPKRGGHPFYAGSSTILPRHQTGMLVIDVWTDLAIQDGNGMRPEHIDLDMRCEAAAVVLT